MSRSVDEWIGTNDDHRAPPRVRARVFAAYGGKCHWSGRKIGVGDPWDLDHIVALINGGENRETNLAPILRGKPHKDKTDADLAIKSKTARIRQKHLGIYPSTRAKIQSRGFASTRSALIRAPINPEHDGGSD
jgi:5-methylcytosine-specific restriction protein A